MHIKLWTKISPKQSLLLTNLEFCDTKCIFHLVNSITSKGFRYLYVFLVSHLLFSSFITNSDRSLNLDCLCVFCVDGNQAVVLANPGTNLPTVNEGARATFSIPSFLVLFTCDTCDYEVYPGPSANYTEGTVRPFSLVLNSPNLRVEWAKNILRSKINASPLTKSASFMSYCLACNYSNWKCILIKEEDMF